MMSKVYKQIIVWNDSPYYKEKKKYWHWDDMKDNFDKLVFNRNLYGFYEFDKSYNVKTAGKSMTIVDS